jgi:peptidase M23-like protein
VGPCTPCNRFEAPPPPDGEAAAPATRPDYVKYQLHEAVDLEGEAGDCAFAADAGRVVEVAVSGGGTRANVTIDHHPFGSGLVSRYLHLEGSSLCVQRGAMMTKGEVIGRLGSQPTDPHLHFELRIVGDRTDRTYWGDRSSIALDPTRVLHPSEAQALAVQPSGGPATVTSIGVETVSQVPLFRAHVTDSPEPYSVPLYQPVTEHERGLMAVFAKALELGRAVEVDHRDSLFFGPYRVPASVRLV